MSGERQITVYDLVGGDFFRELVEHFYAGVAADEVLQPMYPADLTEAKANLAGFLVQYWGGPTTYSDVRGHPRLRMRHFPFAIGQPERDAWARHMHAAVVATVAARQLPTELVGIFDQYFENAATHLINQPPP